ncbi:hypothetical protein BD769DRAFT_1644081 [Suillus cothurnatus]|nr:hypothetical protein BD769DRAFT_1644081 [Suillus cothurnatus]
MAAKSQSTRKKDATVSSAQMMLPDRTVSTSTTSGRQRRPTEKENYRISESQHTAHRQQDKEKKLEKQKKRALQAAYKANPNAFEEEPSELHSDVDMEEDTMFEDRTVHTKLSNGKKLSLSMGKIPPSAAQVASTSSNLKSNSRTAKARNGITDSDRTRSDGSNASDALTHRSHSSEYMDDDVENSESTCDSDMQRVDGDDSDSGNESAENDENDGKNDATGRSPSVTLGTKRPSDTTLEDAMVPKVKRNLDGSRQRLKAGDFDATTKDILVAANSIFRCLIVTQAPFPDTVLVETKLAKEAWREACNIPGVSIKLTPSLLKVILRRTSHVRGELKTKMRSLTASFFGFRSSGSKEVIRQNRDLAESLKEGSRFAFKDWEGKSGIYKTELLQMGVNIMWFTNRNDEGIVYHKYFNPFRAEAIALVLMAIECCIDEWATGLKEDVKFSAATYSSVYSSHFDSLRRFEERTAAYKLFDKICVNLHDTACFHAGLDFASLSTTSRVDDEAFDEAIQEYQLGLVDEALKD